MRTPLKRDNLRVQVSALTSGAFPVGSPPYCSYSEGKDPKWCAQITAAKKLDKAVTDVKFQVSVASTAPLERDESLRVQVSALTSGAFPLACFPYCRS